MSEILDLESQVKAAKQAYQQSDYSAAASLYAAAASAYQARGKLLLAAEMANNQSVALLQAGDAQGALVAASGTEAVFEDGGDQLKAAMAIGNQAAALDALNRLQEAEELYQRCAAILKDLGEEQLRAQVMQSLSALQLRGGRQLEALASMQAGVQGIQKPNLRQRMLKKLLDLPNKLFKGK